MSSPSAMMDEGVPNKLAGIRRAAARHMVRAWEAPSFSLSVEIDMTALLERKDRDTTVTDLLIQAVARTLVRHPDINAWYHEDNVVRFPRAHVGIAVAADAGLVVPVVHGADQLPLDDISRHRQRLVAAARDGILTRADISGGTFTVSNLGMQGVDRFTAIVNAPQVAILAVGATRSRFRQEGHNAMWLPIAEFTLSCDHRVVDGALGSAFLADLRESIE